MFLIHCACFIAFIDILVAKDEDEVVMLTPYIQYRYTVGGQVSLVRLQTDNFRLHDEQTVNGLRKIVWASVFRLKRQQWN